MTADYPAPVRQRFMSPGHAGTLEPGVTTGRGESPGADLLLELDVRIQAGNIVAAAFRAHGCPATVAAADWLCERVTGESLGVAGRLTAQDIEAALELAPEKRVCCLVAIDALGAALEP